MGRKPWYWPGCKSTEGANSHDISGSIPANVEKSLWQGACRMNQVVGHHEGKCRWDTKICHKADEDHNHDADGDGTLRIYGFSPCRMGGSTASSKHWSEIKKLNSLLNIQNQDHLLPTPNAKGSQIGPKPLMECRITMLPLVAMKSKPRNA